MTTRGERAALDYLADVGLIAEDARTMGTGTPAPGMPGTMALFDLGTMLDPEPAPIPTAPLELRCPRCTGLLAEATGVCTVCGHDPLGYYCDELDHRRCAHS